MTIKQIPRPVEVKVIMKLYLNDCCYIAQFTTAVMFQKNGTIGQTFGHTINANARVKITGCNTVRNK